MGATDRGPPGRCEKYPGVSTTFPEARIPLVDRSVFSVNGVPSPFMGSARSLALLAYMLNHREREITCREIATAVWPDEPELEACARVEGHLVDLTSALPQVPEGESWFGLERECVCWSAQARGSLTIDAAVDYRSLVATALLHRALGLIARADFEAARARTARAHCMYLECDDPRGALDSTLLLGQIEYIDGEFASARTVGERALEQARAAGDAVSESIALANLGAAERETGSLETAIARLRSAIEIAQQNLSREDVATMRAEMAFAQLRTGDPASAASTIAAAGDAGDDADERHPFPHYRHWVATHVYAAAGDRDRARAEIYAAATAYARTIALIPEREARNAYNGIWFNSALLRDVEALRHGEASFKA